MAAEKTVDLARRLAELGEVQEAQEAYSLAIHQARGETGAEAIQLEGALYILQSEGNYKISYDAFLRLHGLAAYHQQMQELLTGAFYAPNEKALKSRYERNVKLLQKYPYLFRKDFPKFAELPIRYYPYDDDCYVPYTVATAQFGPLYFYRKKEITHHFFKDLEKPIFARDIFSLYELEYLRDNVRKSEWVARENHIYLHYTDWGAFCAMLQVVNVKDLLAEEKFVFLIEDEEALYPLDFKKKFGIDYTKYEVKPFGIREFQKLIWHTQLATHNGGDFFNEICDGHPNLLVIHSIMMELIQEKAEKFLDVFRNNGTMASEEGVKDKKRVDYYVKEASSLPNKTQKDFLLFHYLVRGNAASLDWQSRIVPAVLFQPHFYNISYKIYVDEENRAILHSEEYEEIQKSPIFNAFRYIKTFTPIRRPTTSVGAAVRFVAEGIIKEEEDDGKVLMDLLANRLENRSYLIDWQDRLFQDCRMLRFEDGKLNPKATFTALAEFLDIPYTETMTYCSDCGERDPESLAGNARGFSLEAVNRTYDEYLGAPERYLLEYFMRDIYDYMGYEFQHYDGKEIGLTDIRKKLEEIAVMDSFIIKSYEDALKKKTILGIELTNENGEKTQISYDYSDDIQKIKKNRETLAEVLYNGLTFYNKNGQPLHMMPKLALDPDLLENPLYH